MKTKIISCTTRIDQNDVIETTTMETRTPIEINFHDILDATKIEYDEGYCETPWENCDGFEHTVRKSDYTEATGYYRARRESGLIVLTNPDQDYKWYRKNGCSKQVAREAVAKQNKQTLEQLVRWYEQGWEWYQVTCSFEDYQDSIGGIDSYEYAKECQKDIALQVASQMEDAGHIIINKPATIKHKRHTNMFVA